MTGQECSDLLQSAVDYYPSLMHCSFRGSSAAGQRILACLRSRDSVTYPFMQRGHQTVIISGLALITISLIGFYLASDKVQKADSYQAFVSPPPPESVSPKEIKVTPVSQAVFVSATPSASATAIAATTLVSVSLSPTPQKSSSPVPTTQNPTLTASPTPSIAPTSPPEPVRIVINEVGWMGTRASATDEWLELYNPTGNTVDLSGWILKSATDDSPHIVLEGSIGAHGYFLIERTDDDAIGDIPAQMAASFGQGGLKDAGEVLILMDATGNVMDRTGEAGGAWPAGIANPEASMERVSPSSDGTQPASWVTNDGVTMNGHDHEGGAIRGTPGARNSATP